MKYQELMSLLLKNAHCEDWVKSIDRDHRYTFTLREDISVTIKEKPDREDNDISNEFTDKFINSKASYHYYSLNYNGSTVKNVCLYMVDGARAYIPSPRGLADTHIEDDDLIVGVIIDRILFDTRHEDTFSFIDKSGLTYQSGIKF
ncbi:hypothetical protein HRF59_17810 [Bacillus velezensis]|uniref:hypothetical protein n=1 Tax=Bacillus TaxID=1386 RepID=UPI0004A79DE5|nr:MULTISPECIES: hypothetical protein [Bacillus]ATU27768.1 hypothetical protein BMJ37_13740 [Bacillus velezensis]AUS15009.1 hypothetical protein C0W57_01905 [Bacillus velezensis]KAF1279000.1 hypothetical protein BUE72_03880 [Bacillus amyloliquefaciens]MCA1230079.1 hypothetical protein [Bacillus velezensis]MCA1308850.1 hypothetical protein [Bacillus velezensis]